MSVFGRSWLQSVSVNHFSWTMTGKTAGVGVSFDSEMDQFRDPKVHKLTFTTNNKPNNKPLPLLSTVLLNQLSLCCHYIVSLLPARGERLAERQQRQEETFLPPYGEDRGITDREFEDAQEAIFDEDLDSDEEEPRSRKRSTTSKSSKHGKQKKKPKNDNSDTEDADQSPKRRPLSQIFHQERHDNRISNHPSSKMAPKTRQSGSKGRKDSTKTKTPAKNKKKLPTGKRKNDSDYDTDTSSPAKLAKVDIESATEYRATLKARYQLVLKEKKHKATPDDQYDDYQKIVKRTPNSVFGRGSSSSRMTKTMWKKEPGLSCPTASHSISRTLRVRIWRWRRQSGCMSMQILFESPSISNATMLRMRW